ncbi:hypothetical protein [Poritiphilus flavus]|uniref:Uncharacterized protein n=1 Tax=Poritiphilus flavus TaxID=2697053 RepID=A0A6L9E7K9_9FLAO|nr:hypothetical protein [Poritiphilus flavus]NAS10598.1 hypothetical protein [Poritiphilus flavus]
MKWNIPNIYFVIVHGILAGWIVFLSTKGALTNNSYDGFFERITIRGRITAGVLLAILILLILQEFNNQNGLYNKDKIIGKEQLIRDSIITASIKKGVDSASSTLFNSLAIAFSNQNLKIDTLKNTINTLSKSPKVTNIINEKDPIILIRSRSSKWSGIYYNQDIDRYDITIESLGAGSTNFNIQCYLLIEFENGLKKLEKPIFLREYSIIMTTMHSPLTNTTKDVKELYLYINGTYSNLSLSKNYKVDYLWSYDKARNETLGREGGIKTKIVNEIYEIAKSN